MRDKSFLIAILVAILVSNFAFGQEKPTQDVQQQKIEKILKGLKDENSNYQYDAVLELSELGAKNIVGFLKNENAFVREGAIEALVNCRANEYAKDIAELLKDEDATVRIEAISALVDFRAKEYTNNIAAFLTGKEDSVRNEAVYALGILGAREYTNDIAKFLYDVHIQCSAACVLIRFGAKEYAQKIAELLNNGSQGTKCKIIECIYQFNAKYYSDKVAQCLSDKDFYVRSSAVIALGKLDERKYIKEILSY